jgi:hypothetical protein
MLFPKFVLEDLSVGSGSIIGNSNIEEFFNHISEPKRDHKGSSKTYLDKIQCLIDKTSAVDLNAPSENT